MEEQKIRRDRYMGMNLRRLRMNAGLSQEKLCAQNCSCVAVILGARRTQNMNPAN